MSIDRTLAIDANALAAVKRTARDDPQAGLRAAAQQFEAIFLQMVLKAMRDAVPEGGMFDSSDTRLYRSLLDQQLSQTLSARGSTGLAAMMEKQLGGALIKPQADAAVLPAPGPGSLAAGLAPQAAAARQSMPAIRPDVVPRVASPTGETASAIEADTLSGATSGAPASAPAHAREFAARLWPYAQEVSRATGIPAHFFVAHAALETGWGRGETRLADGRPSYNLFNIKAGRSWSGPSVEVVTTEYIDGVPRKQAERFRAYGSYAEAFADYAALLQSRYANVVGSRDAQTFARGLQDAGYATDPMYADKLTRIIGGTTLRASLAG